MYSHFVSESIDQIDLIPISAKDIIEMDIVRPEMNLEKHAIFLFPHTRAKNLDKVRKKEWVINLPDGRKAQALITVSPLVGTKAYTSRSYDVYLALVSIWEQRGRPNDSFFVSLNEIAKNMGWKSLNGKRANIIMEELGRLYGTAINWQLSYENLKNKSNSVKNQKILDVYDYNSLKERFEKGDHFTAQCEVRFDRRILRNLLENKTIPVNLTTRRSIKSQLARVLFTRVDNILTYIPSWEIGADNLLEELQINEIEQYQYPSKQKELLDRFQRDLDKKQLSSDGILSVAVIPMGNSWKMKFVKIIPNKKQNKIPLINTNSDEVAYLAEFIGDIVGSFQENQKLYILFARSYSRGLIERALGEFKEEIQINPKLQSYKAKFFTIKMHALAHSMGKEWIKNCGKNCNFRPENNLFLKK